MTADRRVQEQLEVWEELVSIEGELNARVGAIERVHGPIADTEVEAIRRRLYRAQRQALGNLRALSPRQ